MELRIKLLLVLISCCAYGMEPEQSSTPMEMVEHIEPMEYEQASPWETLPREITYSIFDNIIHRADSLEEAVQNLKAYFWTSEKLSRLLLNPDVIKYLIIELADNWTNGNYVHSAHALAKQQSFETSTRQKFKEKIFALISKWISDYQRFQTELLAQKMPDEALLDQNFPLDQILIEALNKNDQKNAKFILNVASKMGANTGINAKYRALMYAARLGNSKVVKLLLNAGAVQTINKKDKKGINALMYAAFAGNQDSIRMLIDAGAAVNEQDSNGMTALMYAAKNGRPWSIEALLNVPDIEIDRRDVKGATALLYAAQSGNARSVELLAAVSARVINEQDAQGMTALMYAAENLPSVEMLLKVPHIDVNIHDNTGASALLYAGRNGKERSVILLLLAGATVNVRDANGTTILMYAARTGNPNLVKLLLEKGAATTINEQNKEGMTALMYAARTGTMNLDLLLEQGAKATINVRDQNGMTALMYAAQTGNAWSVHFLLQAGAVADAQDNEGNTALMYAVRMFKSPQLKGNIARVMELLVEASDINIKNTAGKTASMIAQEEGYQEAVNLISVKMKK